MSRRFYAVVLILMVTTPPIKAIAASRVLTVRPVHAQKRTPVKKDELRKQEVTVIFSDTRKGLADKANQMGEQGWELVSVIVDDSSGYGIRYTAYLKRPKH